MEDTPNDQPQGSADVGDGGLDQSMIDALMNGASSDSADAPSEAPPTPESSGVQEVSQADIDALMSAAKGEEAPESSAGDTDQEEEAAKPSEPEADARVDTLGRPFDEAAAAMQAAIEEEKATAQAAAASAPPPPPPPPQPSAPPPPTTEFEFPELSDTLGLDIDPKRVAMLNDVNLRVEIELGRTRMLVEDVLKLDEGSVVELDKLAGDPVDVYVNGRLIARGEVLILNDNFCVRISEVLSNDPHRVSA